MWDAEAARLLLECAAAPDDDAPRLVWADRVGGERGELVVLQCDLARGGLSPEQVAARRRRERELLERHAIAWAGTLPRVARRWSFRRGFVEAALVDLDALDPEPQITGHPLLASLVVESWNTRLASLEHVVRMLDLRALALQRFGAQLPSEPATPELLARLAAGDRLRNLRAFGIEDLHSTGFVAACEIVASAPIEQLRLRRQHLTAEQLARFLAAAPALSVLEMTTGHNVPPSLAEVARRPLRALRLDACTTDQLRSLDHGRTGETLEHLAVWLHGAWTGDLVEMRGLRTLELVGAQLDALVRAFVRAELPQLRVLRLGAPVSPATLHAIAERFGDQLELFEVPASQRPGVPRSLRGEVRMTEPHSELPRTLGEELVHESPAAAFTLGRPWFARAPAASLARLDEDGPIYDLAELPADERVMLGQSTENRIPITSSTIGRRHAWLHWRDGHHEIHDMSSTNGTIVRDERVARAELRDGDEIRLGSVLLCYFVGPGAHERARAALAAARDLDPVTRLPWQRAPVARLQIADWSALADSSGPVLGDQILRGVARELLAQLPRGEHLGVVETGCFAVDRPRTAEQLARPYLLVIDGETVTVTVVATRVR